MTIGDIVALIIILLFLGFFVGIFFAARGIGIFAINRFQRWLNPQEEQRPTGWSVPTSQQHQHHIPQHPQSQWGAEWESRRRQDGQPQWEPHTQQPWNPSWDNGITQRQRWRERLKHMR